MAVPACCLRSVLRQCHRHVLTAAGYSSPSLSCTNRSWATIRFYAAPATAKAAKNARQDKSRKGEDKSKKGKESKDGKQRDTTRPRRSLLTGEIVDDVYIARNYPKPLYEIETAVDMLKTFQKLDFTYPGQPVYTQLRLDMKLEKKNAEEAQIARDNGAAFVGGNELVQKILDDEIQADFYIAMPEIVSNLTALKNKLRKKFPKTKRGTVGRDIPKMIQLLRTVHEYMVEKECYVQTKIATLDMPHEHIIANLEAFIKDTCTHRALSYGPFVERAILSSATSEGLYIKFQRFLPQEPENPEGN
ncbi:large ribosomal subunit protein uL1m isoform X2 [Ascaphus truei]|uniref:large ribosomal subunit protein uL1m isoform X2 n=1 Tax=Ascaphus truei TaxID=8439 RepID=UPI003F59B4DF